MCGRPTTDNWRLRLLQLRRRAIGLPHLIRLNRLTRRHLPILASADGFRRDMTYEYNWALDWRFCFTAYVSVVVNTFMKLELKLCAYWSRFKKPLFVHSVFCLDCRFYLLLLFSHFWHHPLLDAAQSPPRSSFQLFYVNEPLELLR